MGQRLGIILWNVRPDVPENADCALQELHRHPLTFPWSRPHCAKDWHHLEHVRTVHHNVLSQLHFPHTEIALNDNYTTLSKRTPCWRWRLLEVMHGDLIVMQPPDEVSPQHRSLDTFHASPTRHATKFQHLLLACIDNIVDCDLRPIQWCVIPWQPDFVLRRQADVRHCSLGLRLEDSDNPPFQVDWGQSLVGDLSGGPPARLLITKDSMSKSFFHEILGHVDAVTKHRVLHALCTAHNTAIASPCSYTNPTFIAQRLEHRYDIQCSQHCSCRVVRVNQGRQPKHEQEDEILVGRKELVQGSFMGVAYVLDLLCQLMGLLWTSIKVQEVQAPNVDEYACHCAHLVDILQSATLDLLEDSRWHVSADCVQVIEFERSVRPHVIQLGCVLDGWECIP
mmetsp:Transcript_22095/g.50521  ORF Transcript_22095/g.50521 Transcript_22095/m.50521 type:complete len:395 (+) Transcript_22095:1269-2453(+)